MKTLTLSWFSLLTTCAVFAATAQLSERTIPMPTQQILNRIKNAAGLDAVSAVEKSEPVSLSDVDIPFLASQIKNQSGIRVSLKPTKIRWRGATSNANDSYTRNFTIYLDAEATTVIAITGRLAQRSPDIHEPSREDAEVQLRANSEGYVSFPAVDPKITFMDALEKLRTDSIARPPDAQEIDGLYVMYSRMDEPPHPVWIITLRGLPYTPMPSTTPLKLRDTGSPPIWQRNFIRSIVDAATGKWILSTNSPCPK